MVLVFKFSCWTSPVIVKWVRPCGDKSSVFVPQQQSHIWMSTVNPCGTVWTSNVQVPGQSEVSWLLPAGLLIAEVCRRSLVTAVLVLTEVWRRMQIYVLSRDWFNQLEQSLSLLVGDAGKHCHVTQHLDGLSKFPQEVSQGGLAQKAYMPQCKKLVK